MNPQIFVSYSRRDGQIARRLKSDFRGRGWEVYLDVDASPGKKWSAELRKRLGMAKAVVVLWSRHSAGSFWVRAEAAEAARRGTIIPVVIEPGLDPPDPFDAYQAHRLGRWTDRRRPRGLDALIREVSRAIKGDRFHPWFTEVDPDDAITRQDLALVHRSWHIGQSEYQVHVVLHAHPTALKWVKKVVYTLEGWGVDARDDEETCRNPNEGFLLEFVAWSPFLLRAKVYIQDQIAVELDRFINLTEESEPIDEFLPGAWPK